MIHPGVKGDNEDLPMIPESSIDALYKKAKWTMKQE